jgi:hypothetical protein
MLCPSNGSCRDELPTAVTKATTCRITTRYRSIFMGLIVELMLTLDIIAVQSDNLDVIVRPDQGKLQLKLEVAKLQCRHPSPRQQ